MKTANLYYSEIKLPHATAQVLQMLKMGSTHTICVRK